eukprot:TRINITY_DN2908_c0_g1_i1.p1 TRINITY_DN2908_c0_g1~~TRINITY_DN2908_c0_g1_i1.p1  ORF type:complete len:479 (+),score=97.13 TRINITY_DN2908_c0_g1_i1:404-1840(+)
MRRVRSLLVLLCCACFFHGFQVALPLDPGTYKISIVPSEPGQLADAAAQGSWVGAPAPTPGDQSVDNQDALLPFGSPGVNPNPFLPSMAPSPSQPLLSNSSLPMLSGICPFNFTAATHVVRETAIDCWSPLASYLGNAICCPQLATMLNILIGQSSKMDGMLALNSTVAEYCFSDVQLVLKMQGANGSLSHICSAPSSNLTEGLCPVKSVKEFEETVNSNRLLSSCKTVNPVKECCNPICQPAISEAARKLALKVPGLISSDYVISPSHQSVIADCEKVALRWVASQLSFVNAKAVLRGLFNCNVNKACPLFLPNPSEVTSSCANTIRNETKCCKTLEKYISGVQQQSLVTNFQASACAESLGTMLQRKNVTENVYSLCGVSLKDFSLQAFGSQGCLLQSLPSDVTYDKITGISFTCDLNDNIAAPWPSVFHASARSSCNKSINMPAFPAAMSSSNGQKGVFVMTFVMQILAVTLLYA